MSTPPLPLHGQSQVPTERRVCCGVANTEPTTPALARPPCETSVSTTSGANIASAVQKPPARSNVPTTTPGTCVVCLSHSEEIVGPAWLHRESTIAGVAAAAAGNGSGETGCTVSACVSCLKTYFEVKSPTSKRLFVVSPGVLFYSRVIAAYPLTTEYIVATS